MTGTVVDQQDGSTTTVPGPGWDAVIGTAFVAGAVAYVVGRTAARIARPIATLVLRPPLVPTALHPARGVDALARLGAQQRATTGRDLERIVAAMVPAVVDRVLRQLPLTELVKEHVDIDAIVADVDLDAVVARIDLDAIAGRLDVEAIISRIDLIGLADDVIEGIDLPEIIRASTGTVASEVVRGVRMQSIDADEAVARVVDRLFLRRRHRITDAPDESPSLDQADGYPTAAESHDGARPQVPT
ncbi:MAG TPA: hypothetical protein VHI11_00925 [Jiangellaceae bacterium]|nr:hypothetical protein [Jiangellaceae bacterium]